MKTAGNKLTVKPYNIDNGIGRIESFRFIETHIPFYLKKFLFEDKSRSYRKIPPKRINL